LIRARTAQFYFVRARADESPSDGREKIGSAAMNRHLFSENNFFASIDPPTLC
jgi:hypothetical protein